jgi:predicted RNase H-like nuclease
MIDRGTVAGIDGCRGGWVALKVDLASHTTIVELVDLPAILRNRPDFLVALTIDIPIGLLDGPRPCDCAARNLLGARRGCSVFAAPSRAALLAKGYLQACDANKQKTGRKLSGQSWCICPKIKEVDDAISPSTQKWASEVHPEVSFWAMNNYRPMAHRKKSRDGQAERLALLARVFPGIEEQMLRRPIHVGVDDLFDAAVAAWSALRICEGTAACVCKPELDERGLEVTIRY